jgi:hypothetical protein
MSCRPGVASALRVASGGRLADASVSPTIPLWNRGAPVYRRDDHAGANAREAHVGVALAPVRATILSLPVNLPAGAQINSM